MKEARYASRISTIIKFSALKLPDNDGQDITARKITSATSDKQSMHLFYVKVL
jgi:hypothetical protein